MFDERIKNKLDNHEVPVNPKLWTNLEQKLVNQGLTNTGSSFLLKKVLPVLSVGIIAISSLYFFNDSKPIEQVKYLEKNTNNQVIQTQVESTITHVTYSNQSKKINTTNVISQVDETNDSKLESEMTIPTPIIINLEKDLVSKPITKNYTKQIVVSPVEKTSSLSTTNDNLNVIESNSLTLIETKEIEFIDKIHEPGEYVTIRVDFQNYADEKTNHMKMWEEFPDWVDVNTLEMVNQKNSMKIKTRIIPSQNSVIWKVHGDFSNNINSDDSKGFLEYKIQLTEPTRASELEKLKPEVK